MRGSRLVYALVLMPSLLGLVAYALIKGLTYWRNPELLGASSVAVALSLGKLVLVLIGAFMALKQLQFHFGRGRNPDGGGSSLLGQSNGPGSQSSEDQLRAAAAGAGRKPLLGVALVAVLFAMPVLMVVLSNGGSLAAAPMYQLAALALIELVMATVVVRILIRVRRIRRDGTVDRPRE